MTEVTGPNHLSTEEQQQINTSTMTFENKDSVNNNNNILVLIHNLTHCRMFTGKV